MDPYTINFPRHRRLSGCAWMLTVIKSLTSTNLHQRGCKFPTFQCSLTLVCMRVISTAPMSTGVNNTNSADGDCLLAWASSNNLALLHDPKDEPSFHSGRWNTGTNPDLAFTTVGPDSRLPYRRVLEKFPRSQPGMWKRIFFKRFRFRFRFHTYRFSLRFRFYHFRFHQQKTKKRPLDNFFFVAL